VSIETELLEIKGNKELLTAEEVVAWARTHPNSALHNAPEFFGWDEKKLAYQQMLNAARRLIVLHLRMDDAGPRFVSLSVDRGRPGGGYRDIHEVVQSQSLYDIMLADALNELERIQRKYERVKALAPVFKAVRRVRTRQQARKGKGEQRKSA
jgi:hypothetical protein